MTTHVAAVAALVTATGIPVYDTDVDRPDYNPADWGAAWTPEQRAEWALEFPYAVITAPTFMSKALTIDGARDSVDDYFQLTVAGLTVEQQRRANQRVQDAVNGGRPVVEDWNVDVTLVATGLTDMDRDVEPPVAFGADTYRYRATPSS